VNDTNINIRVDRELLALAQKALAGTGHTVSDVVRAALQREANPPAPDADAKRLAEIKRILGGV